MFIRVRGAAVGDPLHEFDVPESLVKRHPDRYAVVDKKPVAKARPASHISGVVKSEPKRKTAAKPKRASKTGEDKIAPSAGLTPEEEK